MKAQLTPRKRPSQRRSASTVDAILEAAARILEQRGLEGFNTNAVASVAGVSIGSFYQYFPRKEAVTAALIVRAHRRIVECLHSVLADTDGFDLDAMLDVLLSRLIAMQADARKLHRILEHEEQRLSTIPGLSELECEIGALNEKLLARYIDMRRITEEELSTISRDIICMARAILDYSLHTVEADTPTLHHRLHRAVKGYLSPLLPLRTG